ALRLGGAAIGIGTAARATSGSSTCRTSSLSIRDMDALTVIRAWLTLRPIRRWKERRARRRDEAAAAGGEYLYEEDEPMLKNVLKGKLTYASVVALVLGLEIGRASCRERVWVSVGAAA